MKIRDRYIAKTLLTYTIIVLVVWIGIYSFFNFLAELNSVGVAEYTILSAFTYIVLQLPEVAYRQASPIILLGCILGMGHLATTGQLLIFQLSGSSILKITLLTLKNSLIFVLFFICLCCVFTLFPSVFHFPSSPFFTFFFKKNYFLSSFFLF